MNYAMIITLIAFALYLIVAVSALVMIGLAVCRRRERKIIGTPEEARKALAEHRCEPWEIDT